MDFKDGCLMSLCLCPFPNLSPSLSLTCKWQKDSTMTFDTPPLCFLEGPDNCYGNGMSPRSVDWLILAVSRPDESFDPACLFRSGLVDLRWHVCRLGVSCVAVLKHENLEDKMSLREWSWSFLSSRKERKQLREQEIYRRDGEKERRKNREKKWSD